MGETERDDVAVAEGLVKVKPLRFEKQNIDGTLWTSELSIVGEYRISFDSFGAEWLALKGIVIVGKGTTSDAAKAAAQADYSARILSALDLSALTDARASGYRQGVEDAALPIREALRKAEYVPGDNPILPWKIGVFMDEVRAILALVPDGPASDGWRDMRTAPKDGTWFAAWQDGDVYKCQWRAEADGEGGGHTGWYDNVNSSFEEPTLWMPLPPPPTRDPAAASEEGE